MPLRIIDLAGTPYDMGYAHGQQLASEVCALTEERQKLCEEELGEAGLSVPRGEELKLAKQHLDIQAEHVPDVHREFCGIADGAGVPAEELLIGNGYTDFRDVLKLRASEPHECTSFLVKPGASADGCTYLGQTWDMHATAEPFVVVFRRQPKDRPQSITLTTAGCLSLVGMNEEGLALGNNNLVPTDARPGVIYLAMIHDFLGQRFFERAKSAITDAPRASGHNYYLADASGQTLDVETSGARHVEIDPPASTYAHANHYEAEALKGLEMAAPAKSSLARKERLSALLSDAEGAIDVARLHECLSDTCGGEETGICRHGEVRSCAAVVMCPQRREVWAC